MAILEGLSGTMQAGSMLNLSAELDGAIEQADRGDTRARDVFRDVGHRMAHGIDALDAVLKPDRIILSGATGRQADYVAGLQAGLGSISSTRALSILRVSRARSADAAARVALNAFVFSRALDLKKLMAA